MKNYNIKDIENLTEYELFINAGKENITISLLQDGRRARTNTRQNKNKDYNDINALMNAANFSETQKNAYYTARCEYFATANL